MEIETYKFKSQDGTKEFEVAFDGLVYANATEQYQKFDKSQQGFDSYKTRTLIPYAQKLIELGKITTPQNAVSTDSQTVTVDDLIIIRKGGNVHEQGTWIHPKLEIVFARWLNDEFAIWCDEKIAELLANGTTTLEPEDRKWVDLIEDMTDCTPGNAYHMSQIRELLLIHEKQGYNIRAFKDLIGYIRESFDKVDHPKIFKNMRKLIKDMYEANELSRTSHEEMLELCTDTVITVLEKEIKAERRLRKRFELSQTSTTSKPSIAELTKAGKAEHDNAIEGFKKVIDARFLRFHKKFELSTNPPKLGLPVYSFGMNCPVADCKCMIRDDGYRLAFSGALYTKPYDAIPGYPDLLYKDPLSKDSIALWFHDGYVSCIVQENFKDSCGKFQHRELLNIKLYCMLDTDPAFFTGVNDEGTVRITMSTKLCHFMMYGVGSDK